MLDEAARRWPDRSRAGDSQALPRRTPVLRAHAPVAVPATPRMSNTDRDRRSPGAPADDIIDRSFARQWLGIRAFRPPLGPCMALLTRIRGLVQAADTTVGLAGARSHGHAARPPCRKGRPGRTAISAKRLCDRLDRLEAFAKARDGHPVRFELAVGQVAQVQLTDPTERRPGELGTDIGFAAIRRHQEVLRAVIDAAAVRPRPGVAPGRCGTGRSIVCIASISSVAGHGGSGVMTALAPAGRPHLPVRRRARTPCGGPVGKAPEAPGA